MTGHFYAIDVETANADRSSICQIGLVEVRNGSFVSEWSTYVNPRDFFDPWNVRIHGIDESRVRGAPDFKKVADELRRRVEGHYLVSHSPFDKGAVNSAFEVNGLEPCDTVWLDSARMSRRAWHGSDIVSDGVALAVLAGKLGIEFQHHDALEDAKACAYVALRICEASGLSIEEWQKRQNQPVDPNAYDYRRQGKDNGPLSGEVIVFTGELSQPRRVMADTVAALGASVANGVTKQTTILIVGDQDTFKLAGYNKSSKHRKAEMLNEKGQGIQIISEQDLAHLANVEFIPKPESKRTREKRKNVSGSSYFTIFEEREENVTVVEDYTEGMDRITTFSDGTFEITSNDEHGLVDGQHYTEYVGHIKSLKREGKYQEATTVLLKILDAVENEARVAGKGWGVAPWYYEQLAIIYKKIEQFEKEVEVLERYMKQEKSPGKGRLALEERLKKIKSQG